MHIHVFFQNPSSTMETSPHLYCLHYKYESHVNNGVSKQNAHSVKGVFRKALLIVINAFLLIFFKN